MERLAEAVVQAESPLAIPSSPDLPPTHNLTCCPSYTDKFDSKLTWYEDYIVGCFLLMVGIVSVCGNGLSLLMFWRRGRHLTPAEVLLVNLAFMHCLLALTSYPAPTAASFMHRWVFGDIGCRLYGFVCYLLGVASIGSMTALAVVRYLKTCTHTCSRQLRVGHMKVVLVVVYLYSLFWALPPLLSILTRYEVEPFGTSCTLHWSSTATSARVYIIVVVVMVVVVPSAVMVWCYCRILLLVHHNSRKKLVLTRRSLSAASTEMQITLVSGLVCGGFMIAWLPYAIVSILYGFTGLQAPVYLTITPVLLAKSSCAYNPFIYIFINARYRSEMLSMVEGRWCFTRSATHNHSNHSNNSKEAQHAGVADDRSLSVTGCQQESMLVVEEGLPLTEIGTSCTNPTSTRIPTPQFPPSHANHDPTTPSPTASSPCHPTEATHNGFYPLYRFQGSLEQGKGTKEDKSKYECEGMCAGEDMGTDKDMGESDSAESRIIEGNQESIETVDRKEEATPSDDNSYPAPTTLLPSKAPSPLPLPLQSIAHFAVG